MTHDIMETNDGQQQRTPMKLIAEYEDAARSPAHWTPDRSLGESFQESQSHPSWRGFPRKIKTKSSQAGWVLVYTFFHIVDLAFPDTIRSLTTKLTRRTPKATD
jgi:hypothetical protein